MAFIGIHIPILALVALILFNEGAISPTQAFLTVLAFTLLSTVVTLLVLNKLLSPIHQLHIGLKDYIKSKELPDFAKGFQDEVGQLTENLDDTLVKIEKLRIYKENLMLLLSHDLRTPLNSVLSFTSILKSEMKDPQLLDLSNRLEQEMQSQLILLNDLLNLLKFEDGGLNEEQLEDIPLRDLLHTCEKLIHRKLKRKKLTLVLNHTSDYLVTVHENLFRQVLINLLTNAIKFSNRNGEIIVDARPENEKLKISVADQGVGFEDTFKPLLFDKFGNQGRVGTSGEKSTGLGLYLAKSIMTHHKGELEGNSEGTGKGAVFTLTLPCYKRLAS